MNDFDGIFKRERIFGNLQDAWSLEIFFLLNAFTCVRSIHILLF